MLFDNAWVYFFCKNLFKNMRIFFFLLFNISIDANILDREDVKLFIETQSATTELTKKEIENFLSKAEIVNRVIELRSNQPESTFSWNRYRNIFLKSSKLKAGVNFLLENENLLNRVENEYGVSKFYIASIIGAETSFGKNFGTFNPLDTISTLAFEVGSSFWKKELINLLQLSKRYGMDPKNIKSSWAGAIGIGQFIPSSYNSYGVDYDGDSIVDLVNSREDGIASVANYLKVHGWDPNEEVVQELSINKKYSAFNDEKIQAIGTDFKLNNFRTKVSSSELIESGLVEEANYSGEAIPLVVFQGKNTKMYIGFDNFRVITKYNQSSYYALVIHQLAVELKKKYEKDS
tara:strand:- start:14814 stop:15857 length:1044 start_codon:yes stop_codon:yes gene_type:complete